MPGVVGMSVLAGLQEMNNAPPFVLITAFGDPETHAEGNQLGAIAVVDKPFDVAEFVIWTESLLATALSTTESLASSTNSKSK